ncbi:MAG TPA: SCO1664 family protein [Candidatus Binatia bacterium]|nr:SCO1664 family protein [Candidatus Binatia bacterium]
MAGRRPGGWRGATGARAPREGVVESASRRPPERPRDGTRLTLPQPPPIDPRALLELIASGELAILGRLVGSSNNALLAVARAGGGTQGIGEDPGRGAAAASAGSNGGRGEGPGAPRESTEGGQGAEGFEIPVVYKPIAGERPLWDFPDGTLAHREVAAYLLAEAAGWSIVPPTVFRDGPFGPGMVQLWVEADPAVDRVALVVGADPRLRPIALFDVVANNADRKVGHLIPTPAGRILGVDHGICFHAEPKLRTVLWAWRGEPLTADEQDRLADLRDRLLGPLAEELEHHLSRGEVMALRRRIERLLRNPCFPDPDPDRPAIPWPPY